MGTLSLQVSQWLELRSQWLGLRERRKKLRATFGVGLCRGCHRNLSVAKIIISEDLLEVERMECLL